MSRKTELEADLKRVGYQLGGSHLTRQARSATFSTFANTMRQLGYGIHCAQPDRRQTPAGVCRCASRARHQCAHLRQRDESSARRAVRGGQAGPGTQSRLQQRVTWRCARYSYRHETTPVGFCHPGVSGPDGGLGRSSLGAPWNCSARWGYAKRRPSAPAKPTRSLVGTVSCTNVARRAWWREPRAADREMCVRRIWIEPCRNPEAQQHCRPSGQRYLVTRADGAAASNLKQALAVYRNVCHRRASKAMLPGMPLRKSACRFTARKATANAKHASRPLWTSATAMAAGATSRACMSARCEIPATPASTATLGRAPRGLSLGEGFAHRVDQFGDRDAEVIRQFRQHADLHSDAPDFVVADRLLRNSQRIGELLLRHVLLAPQFGNALAEYSIEGFLVRCHRNPSRQWMKP